MTRRLGRLILVARIAAACGPSTGPVTEALGRSIDRVIAPRVVGTVAALSAAERRATVGAEVAGLVEGCRARDGRGGEGGPHRASTLAKPGRGWTEEQGESHVRAVCS